MMRTLCGIGITLAHAESGHRRFENHACPEPTDSSGDVFFPGIEKVEGMRKTRLKQTTIGITITLVSAAVLLALLRTFVINPADSFAGESSQLFVSKGCAQCHYVDSRSTKVGPGLEGLFNRDELPVSGREVTEENVREQLASPYKNMPSFANRLTQEQKDQLLDYLKML